MAILFGIHSTCFHRLFLGALILCLAQLTVHAQEAPAGNGEEATPAARTGGLTGRVFDDALGSEMYGVKVSVEGTSLSAVSDLAGRFRITEVPGGTYTLSFSKEGFRTVTVKGITVAAGETNRVDMLIPSLADDLGDTLLMEELVVTAEVRENSAPGLVALRKSSPAALDVISSVELGKFVATDVADALVRVPGVSIGRGSFAVIRGLGERYSPIMMDGVVVPSSDPERQTPSLDIFPTKLMDSIVVSKTFVPDLPGVATAGAVDLRSQSFPDDFYASVTFGLRASEDVFSGGDFLSYDTFGNSDLWAMGARDRQDRPAPNTVPAFDPRIPVVTKTGSMPLGVKAGLTLGDTIKVNESGFLIGYSLSATYDSGYDTETGTVSRSVARRGELSDGTQSAPGESYDYAESKAEVLIGLLGVVGLQFNEDHEVDLVAFASQKGIDQAQYQANVMYPQDQNFPTDEFPTFREILDYRERTFSNLAARGRHLIPAVEGLRPKWTAARMKAGQTQADLRDYLYRYSEEEEAYLVSNSNGTQTLNRFWRETDERQTDGQFDLSLPFSLGPLKNARVGAGLFLSDSEREFEESVAEVGANFLFLDQPGDLADLMGDTVGFGNRRDSTAEATRELSGGYLALELQLRDWLRLSGGYRTENTEMTSTGIGNLGLLTSVDFYRRNPWTGVDIDAPDGEIGERHGLPSVGLVVTPFERFNVRLAWSQTISRPSYRELGNYYTEDDETDFMQHGNVGLSISEIENYDLRLEYFFPGLDLVALSVFHKVIENPIEKVRTTITGSLYVDTWFNNPSEADLTGFEFEVRKNLGFLAEWLAGVTVGGNYTRIDAEVVLSEEERTRRSFGYRDPEDIPTSRRLFDQPEWLANADLTFESSGVGTSVTLAAVAGSDVLQTVTIVNQFDIFRSSFFRLDLSWSQRIWGPWKMKFQARNLTDPERKLIYDPTQTAEEIVERSFHEGRHYSLALTYDF